MTRPFDPTHRTKVRRLAKRGVYDRDVIDAVLDEALVCHVGFVAAGGHPVVIPTIHARTGDTLYLHGAVGNALLTAGAAGADLCVTATIVDALVLARSAFHHSMNYRSVMVFGKGREVTDHDEKVRALDAVVEHVVPKRSSELRPHSAAELRATKVIAISLDEASAKVRTGGPIDDEDDLALDVWAGLLPLSLVPEEPVRDDLLRDGIPVPPSVAGWQRPG